MLDVEQQTDPYPPTMGELARLILQAQSAGEPVFLSINGQGRLPVVDAESIQELFELVDQLESLQVLRQRIEAADQGSPRYSLADVCQDLRAKHGLPL